MALTKSQLKELRESRVGSVGNRLAKAIELSGETQVAIGQAIDERNTYISDIACGRLQTITVEKAHKFAEYFGCAIEDLFPSREAVA